jgi:hypothetical protein
MTWRQGPRTVSLAWEWLRSLARARVGEVEAGPARGKKQQDDGPVLRPVDSWLADHEVRRGNENPRGV